MPADSSVKNCEELRRPVAEPACAMVLWQPFRRMRFLRRCAMALALASCAMLIGFQMKLMTSSSAWRPPWRQGRLRAAEVSGQEGHGDEHDGRESRTERDRRIMERQIFRDNEQADHRHDDPAPSWSRSKLPWFFTNGTEWPRPSSRLSRLPNVWPDPQSPHDDRIVSQLMYLPPGYKGQPKSINTTYDTNDLRLRDASNGETSRSYTCYIVNNVVFLTVLGFT
ncbi:uncharacterized protein [Dermacentor andersoni]|uniref:uncharacterized protein n=1 Tax=Dermacentor andersoni TaxID=34620 RepID=UPI003B3A7D83